MTFGIIYDERMKDHKGPDSHPECPDRIEAIYNALANAGLLVNAKILPAREVTQKELLRCHDERYLEKIKNKMVFATLNTGDMFTSSGTYLAAKLAAGSAVELADAILRGEIQTGFAIVRPPGHHGKCGSCGGFCFYNNAMLAAIHLTDAGKKVYVVDFDLHLADGTMNMLNSSQHKNNKLINLFSIHRWDNGTFYPGGDQGKTGMDKSGRIVTVGYNGQEDDEYYLKACFDYLLPHMTAFQPDIVIISAGFDAALGDPMEGSCVTPNGYRAMMRLILGVCPKVGMILEGGYGLKSMPRCAKACVEELQASSDALNYLET